GQTLRKSDHGGHDRLGGAQLQRQGEGGGPQRADLFGRGKGADTVLGAGEQGGGDLLQLVQEGGGGACDRADVGPRRQRAFPGAPEQVAAGTGAVVQQLPGRLEQLQPVLAVVWCGAGGGGVLPQAEHRADVRVILDPVGGGLPGGGAGLAQGLGQLLFEPGVIGGLCREVQADAVDPAAVQVHAHVTVGGRWWEVLGAVHDGGQFCCSTV